MPLQEPGKHGAWKWSQPEMGNTFITDWLLRHHNVYNGQCHISTSWWKVGDHLSSLKPCSCFSCPSFSHPGFPLLLRPQQWTLFIYQGLTTLLIDWEVALKVICYPPVGQHIFLPFSWFMGIRAHLTKLFILGSFDHVWTYMLDGIVRLWFECSKVPGNGWP